MGITVESLASDIRSLLKDRPIDDCADDICAAESRNTSATTSAIADASPGLMPVP